MITIPLEEAERRQKANGQGVQSADPPRRRMQPYHHRELVGRTARQYVVKSLLDSGAFSVLYGESGCGKTFLALYLAWSIALGWDWFGLRVRQGAVYYLSAEGGEGSIARRLEALYAHHGITAEEAPLYPYPGAADLRDPGADTTSVIAEMKVFGAKLLIVDTLSRVMAGGNENAPDDMGALVANIDRIRNETGAHVMVIHHSGKDTAKGARGHSLLRAATDTEIEISNGCATVTKARDYAEISGINFKLERVELGTDEDGDPISSCVVIPQEGSTATKARPARLPKGAQIALRALRQVIDQHGEFPLASNHVPPGVRTIRGELWREYAYASGISSGDSDSAKRKAFSRSVEALVAAEVVGVWQDEFWIP